MIRVGKVTEITYSASRSGVCDANRTFEADLFVAVMTGLSCGAVNAMHDSLMPLGGLVPLLPIQLGEVLPGGVGSGLYEKRALAAAHFSTNEASGLLATCGSRSDERG